MSCQGNRPETDIFLDSGQIFADDEWERIRAKKEGTETLAELIAWYERQGYHE